MIGRPRIDPELSISNVTHGIAELHVEFALVRQRLHRVHHHARQAAGVEQPFIQVELPGAGLLRQQPALQAVGQLGDHALQVLQLLVELLAQARQFVRITELLRLGLLVV